MKFFDFFRRRRNSPRKQLEELLEGYSLPSFPVAVMKALEMLRDPDVPMDRIADLIQTDPGMHVTVLKTVNSAAFGLSKKVSNIKHAITLLGKARLETLILPFAVNGSLPKTGYICFDIKKFWLASARRGYMAGLLAEEITPALRMESFTGGLLQDMAVPVISNVKEADYCDLIDQWNRDSNTNLKNLERSFMGFDHQAIGALMAEEWEFPDFLTDAILNHHEEIGKDDNLAAIKLASHLRYCQEDGKEEQKSFMVELLSRETDISKNRIVNLVEKSFAEADEFAAMFS